MGLSDIREYPNIQQVGEFRGRPVTIYAWQITGRLGNLLVDMIQPAEGQRNAYTDFLAKHGDGILSIVHGVASPQMLEQEIKRMKGKGVGVLQQVTVQRDQVPVTYTYFDTETEGKYSLGLVFGTSATRVPSRAPTLSHFGWVVFDAAAVSAYWERLEFAAFAIEHVTPRADLRYRGDPLRLAFDIGFQRHAQFAYEWVSPPPSPQNIYADFLNKHHAEGIQSIGIVVDDLPKSVAVFEKLGRRVLQSGGWGEVGKPESGQYAYLDTDSVGGINLELVRSW
jgi:hypothetical protein